MEDRYCLCFMALHPNQIWVGDITNIATGEGWLYTADRHSDRRCTADGIVPTPLAIRCDPAYGLRQPQYCSREHRALLHGNGLISAQHRRSARKLMAHAYPHHP